MKKIYFCVAIVVTILLALTGCEKPEVSGSYDFIIYESDSDNSDLSDNKIVARYKIEYVSSKTVTDTLIKIEDKYYFSEDSNDYLVLEESAFGLTYTNGYFENYAECENGKEIDVSWSYTAVNGKSATAGIGETSLDGLLEYGFVINGWK